MQDQNPRFDAGGRENGPQIVSTVSTVEVAAAAGGPFPGRSVLALLSECNQVKGCLAEIDADRSDMRVMILLCMLPALSSHPQDDKVGDHLISRLLSWSKLPVCLFGKIKKP